jgi:extracellular elastinolytic metalloproteinase
MMKKITLTHLLVFIFCSSFAVSFKKYSIDYLKKNQTTLQLSDQDIIDLQLVEEKLDDYSNVTRLWFQQKANGIEMRNGFVSVHIKNGKVVNANNSGVFDLKKKMNTSISPKVDVQSAISKALIFNGEKNNIQLVQKGKFNKDFNSYVFEPISGISDYEIQAQLYYSQTKTNGVKLVWSIQYHSIDRNHFWDIEVDAVSGEVLKKQDFILHCSFGKGNYLSSQTNHSHNHSSNFENTPAIPTGATEDVAQTTTGSYRVYPYYIESSLYGTRQLIANPDDPTASPYGWHDTNGAAGAESTKTRGNNVNVYSDKDDDNKVNPTGGIDANYADGGASLVFDFPLDFNTQLDTLTNSQAIQTQLFYMCNIMHDIMAKYGFNETNRNFQLKNYLGNTVTDNDPVNAEAHDGAGRDNAIFLTAPDGVNSNALRSRMQMFMWNGTPPSTLTYNAPVGIAGDIVHGDQNGWGPCSFNVTGPVANATSATPPASYVCGPVNNPGAINGKIALIDRGDCQFSEKVYNAQQAGAIGVIIINRQSAGDSLLIMAAGTNAGSVTIPAVVVTWADGQKLRNNLGTANVTLYRQSNTNCLDLDGALDNGIVAHEYGHGISIRLTGTGPTGTTENNYNHCLTNNEQGGEGWSDFFAMYLTKKPADTKNTPRGMANYVWTQDPNGDGMRRYPYCFDMSVNPLTYADLELNPEVHDIGEVWTSALWDMYWLLIEKYGYDNDLYNGNGGNNKALKLVIEGLKLQKCNPGFLDSRNAILKADSILNGFANRCEIWTAFARRGMGFSALQGSADLATDQTAAFDLHPLCNTTPSATASFTASDTTVCVGGSLTFTSTSVATNGGTLDSIRWTLNGGTPNTGTTTSITPAFNTVGTYTISLIAYTHDGPTVIASTVATKSIRVKSLPSVTVNSATICSGSTATLTASGATTYSWNPNIGNLATVTTPPLNSTTNYTVTGTKDGCVNTAIATVTVNTKPDVNVNVASICAGETATLNATGADSYTWNPNIGNTASVTTPALSVTTNYTVIGMLSNGCKDTAVSVVTVKSLPTVTVNSPTICSGATATLTASGAVSYTWNPNIGTSATVSTPPLTATTNYTVTGIGSNGCPKTVTSTVTVTSTAPTVNITPNPASVCAGESITLTASGADNYTWTSSQTGTTTGASLVFTPSSNVMVNLSGTLTGCGTAGTTNVQVTVKPKPDVTVNSPAICSGTSATLNATGADSYTWNPNIGNTASVTTPTLTNTTNYTVIGTSDGCKDTAIATVTVNAKPTVSVNSASICEGETADLTASGATSYTWTPNIGNTASVTTPALNSTTNYTVIGSDGTCENTAVATVTVKSKPSTPSITQNGGSDTIQSSTIVVGATYEWYKEGNLVATTNNPYYVIDTTGIYTVKVISLGCSSLVSNNFNAIFTAIRVKSNTINNFELYPNPTDGRLVFHLDMKKPSQVSVELYTLEGRAMYSKEYKTTQSIREELDMQEYAKGVYLIKLKVDEESFYHKVVKQ